MSEKKVPLHFQTSYLLIRLNIIIKREVKHEPGHCADSYKDIISSKMFVKYLADDQRSKDLYTSAHR